MLPFAEMNDVWGWGQLAIQGGAFSLLAVIVVYLYPRAAREAREEREKREAAHAAIIELIQSRFEARNAQVVQALTQQTRELNAGVAQSAARIEGAVKEVCKYKGSQR